MVLIGWGFPCLVRFYHRLKGGLHLWHRQRPALCLDVICPVNGTQQNSWFSVTVHKYTALILKKEKEKMTNFCWSFKPFCCHSRGIGWGHNTHFPVPQRPRKQVSVVNVNVFLQRQFIVECLVLSLLYITTAWHTQTNSTILTDCAV